MNTYSSRKNANIRKFLKYSIATSFVFNSLLGAQAFAQSHEEDDDHKPVEEIIVSGAFEGRKVGETILGTTILRKEDIERQMEGTIGETLSQELGISSTFFGPGASRPVIRGLGGDRIRVLDSGLGSIDASSTSPDHGVAVDPALAERIEILRGTAMLQYGSSAAGGIINVIDGRLPTQIPENKFDLGLRYGHSGVNSGDEVAGALNTLIGGDETSGLVFHLDGFYRKTENYSIPGLAESELFRELEEEEHLEELGEDHEEHEEDHGVGGFVENSQTRTKGASAGLSYVFEDGFLAMNYKKLDAEYGVPGGHAEGGHEEEENDEHEEGEEEEVTIDLDQTRFDVIGEIEKDFAVFKKAKFRFGYADYKHIELEGHEVGTIFANKGWEGRLDLVQRGNDVWDGSTGFQIRKRDFSAVGAEAFVPPSIMTQYGLYDVQSYSGGNWRIDFGARYEHTKYELESLNLKRDFDGLSASLGAGYDINDDSFFGLSLFRTERAPSSEELFSNGPHLATGAYELGNADFEMEDALGIEGTYSFTTGHFNFILNGFWTEYNNFIYETPNGDEMVGLPVFEFLASDARFYGFETKAEFHMGHTESERFGVIEYYIDAQLDMVKAKLKNVAGSGYLPRIPPLSTLFGFEMHKDNAEFRAEMEMTGAQKRVTGFELPTEGHTLFNLYLTVRPFDNRNVSLQIRAKNLTNKEARNHTSFLKDRAPMPGRDIRFSLSAEF